MLVTKLGCARTRIFAATTSTIAAAAAGAESVSAAPTPVDLNDAYDAAVFYVARASILRQLDAMGIKPQSLKLSDLSVGSDVSQNFDQLMKLANERLQSAALFSAGNKTDLYIRRLRGGQGIR